MKSYSNIRESKMESPKFKYVMAVYVREERSIWRVPVDWQPEDIDIKWDQLYYKQEPNTTAVQEQKLVTMQDDYHKFPDVSRLECDLDGCQEGVLIGSKDDIENAGAQVE